jgi:2-iminobutanoate/2-iminopropanoate deaminase
VKKVVVQAEMPYPSFPYAHAVRCGSWVFCSGQLAVDLGHGLDESAEVVEGARFLVQPVKKQMKVIYRNTSRILDAAGSNIESVSKVVAFFTRRQDVQPYNEERSLHQKIMPTSAAFPVSGLLAPQAVIEIDPIALVQSAGHDLTPFDLPEVPVHADAGYSKGMRFDDWVFTVGATAADHVPRDAFGASSVAPQARVDPNYWLGSAVKRQVNYVMREKLLPLLHATGCELNDVVRAQVYLTELARDYASFTEVWNEWFPNRPPSTVVMPVNGLGMVHGVVEISLIAVRPGTLPIGAVRTDDVSTAWLGGAPQAVRAGDLIWCSTVAAVDGKGLMDAAADPVGLPYFNVPGKRQMALMLDQLSRILRAGGSDLDRLCKLTVFTSDLTQLPGYIDVWRSRLDGSPCAMTVVEVKGPFFAPGCTVALDAIAVGD